MFLNNYEIRFLKFKKVSFPSIHLFSFISLKFVKTCVFDALVFCRELIGTLNDRYQQINRLETQKHMLQHECNQAKYRKETNG